MSTGTGGMMGFGTGLFAGVLFAALQVVDVGDDLGAPRYNEHDKPVELTLGEEHEAILGRSAIVRNSQGPSAERFAPGFKFQPNTIIRLEKGDRLVIYLSGIGKRVINGPGEFVFDALDKGIIGFPLPPVAVGVILDVSGGSPITRPVDQHEPDSTKLPFPQYAGIPVYPAWPPESPSSRVSLDRFIKRTPDMSLFQLAERLNLAFEDAGYLEHGYYAHKTGFILVTRIEKISSDGRSLTGNERYQLPNDRRTSFAQYIRKIFFDAPPGYYRYIAVVVTNKPFSTSSRRLTDKVAVRRLRRGSNRLSNRYKQIKFTDDFTVEALIYEFRKAANDKNVRMIAPGRISPANHLAKTKLNRTLRARLDR